jgi:hypothetical protein
VFKLLGIEISNHTVLVQLGSVRTFFWNRHFDVFVLQAINPSFDLRINTFGTFQIAVVEVFCQVHATKILSGSCSGSTNHYLGGPQHNLTSHTSMSLL